MKKLFVLPVIALLLSTVSCNKKDDPAPSATPPTTGTSTIPSDGWMLGTTKYKQALTVRQESQFVVNALDGTSGGVNTFAAFFKTYPTSGGKYKIVTYTPTSDKPYAYQWINDGEVVIVATIASTSGGNNKTSYSLGESLEATITITGGKIKVEVPEITVVDANNNQQKLTGTILEN